MADPVTWYALGRTVGDPETIMEAIDEKINAHNQDPNAHGLSDEALYTHRSDETFDHPQYAIYNIKMAPSTRPVKAFVDAGGAAEFERIQDAVDYVNDLGGGTVVLEPGTYYLDATVDIPSHINIEGEDPDEVIVDFSGLSRGFQVVGASGAYKTDINIRNIGFTKNSTTAGDAIYITYGRRCSITGCKFTDINGNINDDDIVLVMGEKIVVADNYHTGGVDAIASIAVFHLVVYRNYIYNYSQSAVSLSGNSSAIVSKNYISTVGWHGIDLASPSFRWLIEGNYIAYCDYAGIRCDEWCEGQIIGNSLYRCYKGGADITGGVMIEDAHGVVFEGNVIDDCGYQGVFVETSFNCVFSKNIFWSNEQYGLRFKDSNCIYHIVLGNQFYNHPIAGLWDDGQLNEKAHNITRV